MKKLLQSFLIIGALVGAWFLLEPSLSDPGSLLKKEPKQTLRPGIPFELKGFTVYPLASYEVDGLVLAFKQYEPNGQFDRLSPFDVGIGWGPMSSKDAAAKFNFSHNARFLKWSTRHTDLPYKDYKECIANVHVIPANAEVEATLSTLKKDDLVSMKGKLVSVTDEHGRYWMTSMRRSDTGAGACEMLYATSVHIINGEAESMKKPTHKPAVAHYSPSDIQLQPFRYPAEVVLISELEIPVDDGAIIVPAGDFIEILRNEGRYTRARYRSHNFWIESDQLDGSI